MGFGFNLFGFPILVVISIVLLIIGFSSGKLQPFVILICIWVGVILLFTYTSWLDDKRTPIRLKHSDIYGTYRIDTNFYPGENARWQYRHYLFWLVPGDSLVFCVLNNAGRPSRAMKYKLLEDSTDYAFYWHVADTGYHVLRTPPTLVRKHSSFYYVFNSSLYGNMFFRKVTN